MAAHRYWRLLLRENNNESNNFVGVREVELRTAIGGADVTGSGTAAASTSFTGLPASQAFDNTTAEWASDGSALPQWLSYDFGAGNDKDIVEVAITSRSAGDQAPTEFDLQWSDDNSSWTTLYSIQDASWLNAATNTYSASSHPTTGTGSQAFWRVNVSSSEGAPTSVVSIADLAMFAESDASGTTLCNGGTAYAKSNFRETPVPVASRAFDLSSPTTYWASSASSGWLGYKFPAGVSVQSIAITARTGSPEQSPKNFTIEYWDGSAFQTFATISGITGWTAGQTRYFNAGGEITAPDHVPGPVSADGALGLDLVYLGQPGWIVVAVGGITGSGIDGSLDRTYMRVVTPLLDADAAEFDAALTAVASLTGELTTQIRMAASLAAESAVTATLTDNSFADTTLSAQATVTASLFAPGEGLYAPLSYSTHTLRGGLEQVYLGMPGFVTWKWGTPGSAQDLTLDWQRLTVITPMVGYDTTFVQDNMSGRAVLTGDLFTIPVTTPLAAVIAPTPGMNGQLNGTGGFLDSIFALSSTLIGTLYVPEPEHTRSGGLKLRRGPEPVNPQLERAAERARRRKADEEMVLLSIIEFVLEN